MITSKLLKDISHGFGTKQDGDGRDRAIIKTIAQSLQEPPRCIVIPGQTHSIHVEIIDPNQGETQRYIEIADTDGVVTSEKGVMLTVVSADCVPILYYDPGKKIIGISHGGWKGTLEKIPVRVVERMCNLGAPAENIHIAIGPSIGSCCYEIYGERLTAFHGTFTPDVIEKRDGNSYIDLQKANIQTLLSSGIPRENIDVIDECTSCHSDRYFSYNRDQGIKGEMLSFVMLP